MIARLLHPLVVAALALVLSAAAGLSRLWMGLEPAVLAAAAAAAARPGAVASEELKQKGWDFWTIEIEHLSSELQEERRRLRKQSESLDQRAARLAAEERELAKVRAEIDALRRELGQRVVEIGADEAKNIRTLASTYSNLTPRAAVAILREMEDATVVKILAVMKPEAVGQIFEEMSRSGGAEDSLARRAAMLSERLRLLRATRPAGGS